MSRVFIYGSCVSRDAFSLPEAAKFSVVEYCARTSLVSAWAPVVPCANVPLDRLGSFWKSRCIQRDFAKELLPCLEKTDFDILLLDFIDERFDIYRYPDGSIITLSSELDECMYEPSGGERISAYGDEKTDLWAACWGKFITFCKEHNIIDKIRNEFFMIFIIQFS